MPVAGEITHTRRLDELGAGDDGSFGGKSAGLGELLRAEIPVPPGFAVSTSAFTVFLEHAGLADRAADALAGVSADDYDAVAAAAHVIGEALRGAALPEPIREEVGTRYAELAASVGAASPPVAVRSSALGEDGGEATFAGQQDTYLWVRGADDICNAVRNCWVSLYSTEAISYRMRLAGAAAERPAMGVTVQLMVDAAVSGVMFTCNPVSGDPSMIAINASWGLGLAVVGGEVTPDDYLVSKITLEVVRERINAKQVEYLPAEGGRGTHRVEIEPARQTARCLDEHTRETLVDLGRRIERHFGGHQDVEWALARGQEAPAGLYVLQSRPVTGLPDRPKPAPAATSALSLVMSKFGARG